MRCRADLPTQLDTVVGYTDHGSLDGRHVREPKDLVGECGGLGSETEVFMLLFLLLC